MQHRREHQFNSKHKILAFIIFLVQASSKKTSLKCLEVSQTADDALQHAKSHMANNALEPARLCLERSITLEPNIVECYYLLEHCLRVQGKNAEADRIGDIAARMAYIASLSDLAQKTKHVKTPGFQSSPATKTYSPPAVEQTDVNNGHLVAEQYAADALAFYRLGKLTESLDLSMKAIQNWIEPRYFVNMGAALYEMQQIQGAINAFRAALRLEPTDSISRFNLANALTEAHQFSASIIQFRKVLETLPNWSQAFANMVRNQETVCDWSNRQSNIRKLEALVTGQLAENQTSSVQSWHALAYPFDVEILKAISRSVASKVEQAVIASGASRAHHDDRSIQALSPAPRLKSRLVVAYVSYCFSNHPTAYLISGIFRHHKRSKFHAACFALNQDQGIQRKIIEKECESFYSFFGHATSAVAANINQHPVHIAVNLDGWTSMGRTSDVFSLTPAPIQMQYMGFPGTLGAWYVPYLLVDRVVAPPEFAAYYTERLIMHPGSYYVNDYRRLFVDESNDSIDEGNPSKSKVRALRLKYGLPLDTTLFCNFNNLYKLCPDAFEIWAKLLKNQLPSHLVLLLLPADAVVNLKNETMLRVGHTSRTLFVPMLSRVDHIERASLCDVFLDTFLVNAHTLAMDVVWAALPMVTVADQRFSSRVAASVLIAAECATTLARTRADYSEIAARIASSPPKSAEVRGCLKKSKQHSPLYDAAGWVREFETILRNLWDLHEVSNPAVIGYGGKGFQIVASKPS